MENIKISKEKLIKIKDVVIFILLFLWMLMPILQTVSGIQAIMDKWYFSLMKTTGGIGIGISILCIYDKIKNSDNKKEVLKEILPIFIFTLYLLWTLISSYNADRKKQAFNGNEYRKEGYFMYLNYAGYFLCAFLLENKKLRKMLLNTFVISSLFLIIVSRICIYSQIFRVIFGDVDIYNGVFKQFNHYGYYLMMSLICSLGLFITEKNKKLQIIYLIAYTIIGYATIKNNTFGCYLAICIFLILYIIYSLIKKIDRKKIGIAIAIFVILSCIITEKNQNIAYRNLSEFGNDVKAIVCKIFNIETKDENIEQEFLEAGTYRMELWIKGIEFIAERPIIGYGPDNLKDHYLKERIDQDRPHNLLIYLACVSGIPGMIIYVIAVSIIVINGIIKLFKNNQSGKIFLIIVITYLISSMFGNSMYYTSPYFFIFLGSLMNCNLQKQEK